MSTDPTANPPDDAPSSQPSDPTQPTFGSPAPTSPTPPPASPTPPAAPPPAPAYGPSQPTSPPQPGQPRPGQPYPTYGQQGPYPPSAPPYQSGMYAGGLEHPQGTAILILGILSIVICQILGPFAWVMGRRAMTEIDASGRAYTNRTMVQAGMICGIIGTVFLALGIAYLVIVFVFLGMAASSGSIR